MPNFSLGPRLQQLLLQAGNHTTLMMMQVPVNEFSLRTATIEDIDGILALQRAAPECAQWPRAIYEKILLTSEPKNSNIQRVVLCVQREDRVEGFLVASFLRLADTTECELENMAVNPTHRRSGLGRHLVAALQAWCSEQHADQLHLEVRASNIAALAFYAKMGFSSVGKRQAYYRQPVEDAVLLAWSAKKNIL